MLDSAYLSYPQYSRNAGILAYSLASAYQGKGDSKNAIKYFAISAISDAISGTRENRSLRILAKLIFEERNHFIDIFTLCYFKGSFFETVYLSDIVGVLFHI